MAFTASIVVPVFSTEDYLRECLQSLLNQTHKNFEIIVVDDCSPGPCEPIVNDFQQLRPDIKYVRHPKNLGLLVARFTGAENSSGDYVGFLDSDDKAKPTFVEMLLTKANETAADIVGSLNGIASVKNPGEFKLEGAKELFEAYSNKDLQNYNVWTKLYRRNLLLSLTDLVEAAKKKRMDSPEDLLINVFCAIRNPTYANVPHVLVEYNAKRVGSLTNVAGAEIIIKDLRGRLDAYELLRNVSGDFAPIVEGLIQRSTNYIFRRLIINFSDDDVETSVSYLVRENGGALILAQMLRAAISERSKLDSQLKKLQDKFQKKIEKLKHENSELKTLKGSLKTILGKRGPASRQRLSGR